MIHSDVNESDPTINFLNVLTPELDRLDLEFQEAHWEQGYLITLTLNVHDHISDENIVLRIKEDDFLDWLSTNKFQDNVIIESIITNVENTLTASPISDSLCDLLEEQMEDDFCHPYDLAPTPLDVFLIEYSR